LRTQDLHDGTAISVRQKTGLAEANITVRPQDPDMMDGEDPERARKQCRSNGVRHWKSASGFRLHKVSEDCKRTIPDLALADDGPSPKKPVIEGEQTR